MRNFIYLFLFAIVGTVATTSCSREEELSATSYVIDVTTPMNEFDYWLETNFLEPYNINFQYRYSDIDVSMNYVLSPAEVNQAILFAKLVKHLTLEAYDEHTGSTDFIRGYFPKMIQLIGSPAYLTTNTMILGEAEGGMTMYLYNINSLDTAFASCKASNSMATLNDSYFQTMHHEFSHIFHQTKEYSSTYEAVTASLYVGDNCWTTYSTETAALEAGFISRYSATNADEDFVEMISTYITISQDDWDAMMATAGSDAEVLLTKKLDICKNYMETSWGVSMDELREIILRRQNEVWDFDSSLD